MGGRKDKLKVGKKPFVADVAIIREGKKERLPS